MAVLRQSDTIVGEMLHNKVSELNSLMICERISSQGGGGEE